MQCGYLSISSILWYDKGAKGAKKCNSLSRLDSVVLAKSVSTQYWKLVKPTLTKWKSLKHYTIRPQFPTSHGLLSLFMQNINMVLGNEWMSVHTYSYIKWRNFLGGTVRDYIRLPTYKDSDTQVPLLHTPSYILARYAFD